MATLPKWAIPCGMRMPPPMPQIDPSKVVTPTWAPASALASAMPLVLCRCSDTLRSAKRSRSAVTRRWIRNGPSTPTEVASE